MLERFTEDTKLVMDAGVAAARQLGHAYLGTEHILIGMVRVPSSSSESRSRASKPTCSRS
jgi:hypothetical protein